MDENFLRDFDKRYRGTVVVVRNLNGEENVVNIREVDMYHIPPRIRCHIFSPNKDPLDRYLNLPDWEVLPVPSRRIFDVNGITYSFSKVPARQWKRGICRENSDIRPVLSSCVVKFKEVSRLPLYEKRAVDGFDLKALYHLFYPKYLGSISAGEEFLERNPEALSVSLSEENWLSLSPIDAGLTLWRRGNPIASINKGSIKLHHALYYQEVTDFLLRSGDTKYATR